jgi:hypothetical protein
MSTLARDECRQELVRRLRAVQPDSARRWGKMSAHQMVCHASDAYKMVVGGGKEVRDVRGRIPPVVIKWIALHLPLRWPQGIETVPEIDQQIGGTSPRDFAADLAGLEGLVEAVAARRGRALGWPTHPVFGRMSEAEWLRWGYLHLDHHLRQFGV